MIYSILWKPLTFSFASQSSLQNFKPLVLSGCSGVGKSTLIHFLTQKHSDYFQLIPGWTTRVPRQNEVPDKDFHFCTSAQFAKEEKQNMFIQKEQIHGNMYGTYRKKIEDIIKKGKIGILNKDIKGGQVLQKLYPDWNYLFIKPKDIKVLQQRLSKRASDSKQIIQEKIKDAKKQLLKIQQLEFYDIIVNENLQQTQKEMLKYINSKYGINLNQ